MISVIIGTRNRAERLRATLDALAAAAPPAPEAWEVIVVENASTDTTADVCADAAARGLPLRHLVEPVPGVARARNRGLGEARGTVIAFLDDDCLVAPGWLATIRDEFARHPHDGIGGRVELHDPTDQPITIRPSLDRRRIDDPADVFYSIPGCNMAFRREVFDRIAGFDIVLGPGTPFAAAEDSDLLFRALEAGLVLTYVPEMLVFHHHGRKSPDDVTKLLRGYHTGRGAFYVKHILAGSDRALRMAYWETRALVASGLGRGDGRLRRGEAWRRIGWLARGAGRYLGRRFTRSR